MDISFNPRCTLHCCNYQYTQDMSKIRYAQNSQIFGHFGKHFLGILSSEKNPCIGTNLFNFGNEDVFSSKGVIIPA